MSTNHSVPSAACDPRYPVGPEPQGGALDPARRAQLIDEIAALPIALRSTLLGATRDDWDRRYRKDGWTVRQLVHHLADSHINAYVRCRLALTEDEPTIKPYDEARWAELADVATTRPEVSLTLLEALHSRWTDLLRALPANEFGRGFFHPGRNARVTIDEMLVSYAWHCRHHLAHLGNALGRDTETALAEVGERRLHDRQHTRE